MVRRTKYLAMVIVLLGIVSLAVGGVFVGLAAQKNAYVTDQLRQQHITTGLTKAQIAEGEVVDNAQTAQAAADKLRHDLISISPTYSALMAKNSTGKYDPTNLTDLDYTQGLNMENALNVAVLGYGFLQATFVGGLTLIAIGVAFIGSGLIMLDLNKKISSDGANKT